MFVIADIEWIVNGKGYYSPTQLAAARVDENWNEIAEFNAFICPPDREFHLWGHVAYAGGDATDFLCAKNARDVFADFEEWLCEDDILLWWYSESKKLFIKLADQILNLREPHKAVSVNKHVYAFLEGTPFPGGNSYRIAEANGVFTEPRLKHFSKNDVRVLRELMQKIGYPQELLLKPLERSESESSLQFQELPYQYDLQTNVIHSRDCGLIDEIPTRGFENLKKAVRKGFKPCDCCSTAYRAALRERIRDIIERTQYTYIYSPDSKVFHKHTCGLMLMAKTVLGARHYKTVVRTGRTPCKICNPTSDAVSRPLPQRKKASPLERKPRETLSKGASKAVKRQKVALEERRRRLQDANLTETERNDVMTLTQPRFAFWVGKGYQSFHRYSCSKLREISNLKGFGTYREAIGAGFTPCKRCRPSKKHDVEFSIPIKNRIRTDEKAEDLAVLCTEAGYTYCREEAHFCLETPVGKWRINTSASPIRLEHINLVSSPGCNTYHEQPRLFLSFLDTFLYIKHHDDNLIRKTDAGALFLKCIIRPE